ncbi:MAG: PD-(D/E)XK nuclease-like domain-containing protein [Emcibacteraceae bacterium]|nr:PD-(D/E)XK nuclease-like domain-containing protein [Emcibacteraceae bacterium]
MMVLDFEEELAEAKLSGLYPEMPMDEYRKADGLANSELQLFKVNPASYEWNKQAPSDPLKATSADFGTALHSSILEPETYEDSVIVSSTKGRTSDAFVNFQRAHTDKLVLTEIEYDQIAIMTNSAECDPMFNKILCAEGICESSIFVTDPTTGVDCKIRPDKIYFTDKPNLCDVKSAADLDEWRQDKPWLNPLFKFNYGFTAAYYLHIASIHYQMELTEYTFLVVSKSARLGKYPVSVFVITKEELIEYGFWDEMIGSLASFAERQRGGDFTSYESFPEFHLYQDEKVEVTFEGE